MKEMKYKSLAAHNSACNEIFRRFQDCENEHPYRRFFGYCEAIHKELNKCIKDQLESRRHKNLAERRKEQRKKSSEND